MADVDIGWRLLVGAGAMKIRPQPKCAISTAFIGRLSVDDRGRGLRLKARLIGDHQAPGPPA